jgi:hypothetical protein
MGDKQMSVLGIGILRAISLEEELGKRTTLGGLRVGRNVDWSSCGHFWCYILGLTRTGMDVDPRAHEAPRVSHMRTQIASQRDSGLTSSVFAFVPGFVSIFHDLGDLRKR